MVAIQRLFDSKIHTTTGTNDIYNQFYQKYKRMISYWE